MAVMEKLQLKVDVDHPKLKEEQFYHILFAPEKRIELCQLPILFSINGDDWEMIDIAQYKLIDLDDELVRIAMGKSKQHYIITMRQKYGRRAHDECLMIVGKFRKVN